MKTNILSYLLTQSYQNQTTESREEKINHIFRAATCPSIYSTIEVHVLPVHFLQLTMNCINRCNDKTFRRILGVGEGDADHMVPDLVKHPQHLTHVDVGLGVIVGQETLTKGSGLQ